MSQGSKDMLDNIKLAPIALLLAAIATCAGPRMVSATGSDTDAPSGWTGSVGLGVGRQPTYVGSPNERTTPVPLLSMRYHHPIHGTLAFDPRGLSWTSPERAGLRVGVHVGFDLGREARGVGSDPFVTGDAGLRGMGDIESTAEGGVLIGFGPVTLSARKAIGDRGHAGLVADLSFDWSLDLSEKMVLTLGAGTRWADQKYQQAYFGVTPAQAADSRFSSFTPAEGFVQGHVDIGLEYRFTEAWSAQLGATYSSLTEETRSSPLAEEPNALTAFLGLARRFE
jgi:outer membrane scaffolding protein for murein synthesis (MipA/OmpV family)